MPDGALDQLVNNRPTRGGSALDGLLGGSSAPAPQSPSYLSYIPGAETTLSVLAPALDFLARGQYASAGFFDALINDNAGIGDALAMAGNELISPTKRKSFTDVISRANPDFARENPYATKILGFLGDVALDPTTYLGFGLGAATKGARIGGRALTTIGEAYQTAARSALAGGELVTGLRAGTREAAEIIGREQLTRLPGQVAKGATFETVENASDLLKATTSSVGAEIRAALGGRLPAGVSEGSLDDLAQKISLERLGLPNLEAAQQPLTILKRGRSTGETVEAADELIGRIASLSQDAAGQIFKPGGLRLSVGVPLTSAQAEIPIINRRILQAVGLDKLEDLAKTVGNLPGIKQALNGGKVLRGAFDRFYDLDRGYVQTITRLQDEYDFIKQDVVRDAIKVTDGITREGRDRITKVMTAFEGGLEGLDDAQRIERAPEVFRMAMRATQLQPTEQAAVMSLIQGYSRAAELERALGVAGQFAANFDPRVYQAIESSADETIDWLKRVGPDGSIDAAGLDPAVLGKAADLANAVAEGSDPAQDAVLLYAQRAIQARQRLPKMQADGALKAIFGTSDPAKLPRRVANDWRYYGEFNFPTFAGDEADSILYAVDWLQRKWKGLKTVVNPSFAPRQAVSNSLQSALVMGNNAYRAFDPRSYSAAAQILWGNRGVSREGLPEYAADWLRRFTEADELPAAAQMTAQTLQRADEANDLARGLQITTPTGQRYGREELELLARQNGILRGTSGFSGESLKRSLEAEIGLGTRESLSGKAFEGVKALADGYLGLSSKVEDTSRLALFINGLAMGDSPTLAAQRVNRALFDYNRAFSRFESEVVKRLVPFYSFQRLALPFVLKSTIESPGAPATLNKVSDLIGNLLSGDKDGQPVTLSPAQREIFGRSFLIEQPRVFRGFDKDGSAVFNVFNNVTPFDVLSLLTVTKKNGEVDWQRTAEKTILGALTPYLKIPAELIANRDFFSDKVIADARGYGGKGKLGAIKDSLLDRALPEPIKNMIGWEYGTDRRTGEQIAYVNPYLAYSMSQAAPTVARLFVKPLADSETPLDRAIRVITGASEQSLDFKQSLDIQNSEDKRFLQELRQKVTAASRTGRQNSLDEALDNYRRVLRAVADRRARTAGLQAPESVETEQAL